MIKQINYKIIDADNVQLHITFTDGSQTCFALNKNDVNTFVFKLDAVFNELLEVGEQACQQ
jgi:hypothetical protein